MGKRQALGLDELMIVNPSLPGVKEKVHLPLYDAFVVRGGQTFGLAAGADNRIPFFVDIQHKTRLETNLQTASALPHYNTFEARAIRVIVSTPGRRGFREDHCLAILEAALQASRYRKRSDWDVQSFCSTLEAQLAALHTATAGALADLIYNSVTSLIVGEKVMIEMPTFWFPSGAGVSPGGADGATNHGEPDPLATFRFAEPVFIEARQNFRVEMTFPRGLPTQLAALPGPLRVWVVLDGYLTRDVQ